MFWLSFDLSITATAAQPKSTAFLGVFLQNDNEGYEPTSDAERKRMSIVEDQFRSLLEGSGRYTFSAMTPEVKSKIDAGQPVGACGGCEADYGKALGAERVAWINVQKISNLILNMNVYIEDVAGRRMLLIMSVDIRGNTDESWSRSLSYLVKNYVLPATPEAG